MSGIDLSVAAARAALTPLGLDLADEDAQHRYAVAVWCQLVEPGDSAAGRVVASLGPVEALVRLAAAAEFAELTARENSDARKRWLPRLSSRGVSDMLRIAGARGVRLVTRREPAWPQQLDDLGPHAPMCLWVRGDVGALARLDPSVALVGARAASGYGDLVARELAAELAGSGVPVVSGGAYGIDGAAHRAALSAGGLTVALLAGGAERAYPAGHTQLIDQIAATGVVASEVPCGSAPTKWRFLQRNRLIAALTTATVVVEAGWRSGSLNTAGHAATLGRGLGAVPGPITSPGSSGTHRLIREYGGAACITSADDVRELLGLSAVTRGDGGMTHGSGGARAGGSRPASAGARTDDTTRVRDALSARVGRDADDVARRAGMAVDDVRAMLGLLRLEGMVLAAADGWRLPSAHG
ncbi:DNA-processing protein DprA [Microbacterium jejuense]|uniref:DNA-processing protein DprA n=1 Tax=Microbacterium jejuense TaxID=1263637 RepID=UPI0031E771AB